MLLHRSYSLLNPNLLKFYDQPPNESNLQEHVQKYFCANRGYDFKTIAELLLGRTLDSGLTIKEFEAYKYENYLRFFHKLLPIFTQSSKVIAEHPLETFSLQWLGFNFEYYKLPRNYALRMDTSTVERLLLLTALMENVFGNVYFTVTEGRTPPHLLKDLLCSEELAQIFGAEAILFIKILVGSPNSINLRNIVWHGFPKPNEIPAYYVDVLLLTLHTLGCTLQEKQFNVVQRPLIQNIKTFFQEITDKFPPANLGLTAEAIVKECNLLKAEFKPYWTQLFHYYRNGQYWQFVILCLPQIELLLRMIYGLLNEYDVSAKQDEYYITMDTIFESKLPKKTYHNEANMLLGKKEYQCALKCMYDVFVSLKGPRLRDKVGHGEVTMAAIDDVNICRILLHVSLNVMGQNEYPFLLDSYESKLHINCQVNEVIRAANLQLTQFVELCKQIKPCEEVTHAERTLPRLLDIHRTAVRIFQRPAHESELMTLTLQVVPLIGRICSNYEVILKMYLNGLDKQQLRERQRQTYEKVVETLPSIVSTLREILYLIHSTFSQTQVLQLSGSDRNRNFPTWFRFVRGSLKICQNLVKYSDRHRNEWIRSLALCKRFAELCKECNMQLN